MTRRGVSLLEAMIALVLTGVVAILAWTILQNSAFRLRDRSERMAMEHALRVVALATQSALEPLGADSSAGPDLTLAAADGFIARATRGSGVACGADAASVTLRAAPGWWSALRVPVPGRDSVMIGTVTQPARWVVTALLAPPSPGSCPDGMASLVLPVALVPADLAGVGAGSPIRIFEQVELKAYASGGASWLGQRSVSGGGAIQPLAGPLAGVTLELGYFSRGGQGASAPGAVARADWRVAGVTERAGGIGLARMLQAQADSGAGTVLLRNAP